MCSSRVESVLLGKAGADTRKYLIVGSSIFAGIAVLSLGFQLLLDVIITSWPRRTGFETVDIGILSVELSNIFWSLYIGLTALGIITAFVTARRNNGLLVSSLFGSAPIIGYAAGIAIYYSSFTELGYSIESVPPSVLYGITIGTIGFILGRI